MTFTVQAVINRVLDRSSLNEADLLSETAMFRHLTDFQREIFMFGARENPNYFGTDLITQARSAFTDGWDLSASRVAAVSKVEIDTIAGTPTYPVGTEVDLVDFLYQDLALPPRVYIRNKVVTGVGTDLGSADANMTTKLKVFYSPLPADLVADTDVLLLPDEWVELLVLPLARLLAIRDGGRDQEVRQLTEEMVGLVDQFIEAVQIVDHPAPKPLTALRAMPRLFSGGTGAQS
jgi:hypothetical protein